ncbi:hypothetical protein A4G19_04920 [Pasteurellaceae bacterium Macca]|nr:hypothetical protein [Pasteurellaceae bacterium Macca]
MNNKAYPATVLLVGILLLTALLATIFLTKSTVIQQERAGIAQYQAYLQDKFALIELLQQDENTLCQQQQQNVVEFTRPHLNYRFHCLDKDIFSGKFPTRKNLYGNDFHQFTAYIENYAIKPITSWEELPKSSLSHPQIVKADNALIGHLTDDFYGILVTEYPVELYKGGKFYGAIYTPRKVFLSRFISYKREVIENIRRDYSIWQYQENSRHLMTP